MNSVPTPHPIQRGILNILLVVPEARFGVLRPAEVSTDHFTYHLNHLVKAGSVAKTQSGGYSLTESGKQLAGLIDTETNQFERQAKLGVMLLVTREQGGGLEVVMQKRQKHPFFGYWGLPTGKVRAGEAPQQAAVRELYEETGLTAEFRVVGVVQRIGRHEDDGHMLEDEFFFLAVGGLAEGEMRERHQTSENYWVIATAIGELAPQFSSTERLLEYRNKPAMLFDFDESAYGDY